MIQYWTNPAVMQRLAGSLLHFFWQGALLAVLAAVSLRLMSRHSAQARYILSVTVLFLMVVSPVLTLLFYAQTGAGTILTSQSNFGAAVTVLVQLEC